MDPQETSRVQLRPRRQTHQVWQIWLRVPAAVYATVVLIYVCYYIGRWNGAVDPWHDGSDGGLVHHKSAGAAGAAALVAAAMSIFLSCWEVWTYVRKRRDNPISAGIVCLDVVVLCVAVAGFVILFLSDWSSDSPSYPVAERPWLDDQYIAAWLSMGLVIMHASLSIAGCCGCCFGLAWEKSPKPAATTSRTVPVTAIDNAASDQPQPPPYYQQVELQAEAQKGPPPEYPGPSAGQASNN